jgi:hypothetical protein
MRQAGLVKFRMNGLSVLGGILASMLVAGAAEEPSRLPSGPVDPARGSVDGSGKFTPRVEEGAAGIPVSEWQKHARGLVEAVGEGRYRIGRIEIDPAKRSLRMPAKVNAREGPLEYALVTDKGKVHESLLSCAVDPLHFHLAALLAGLAPKAGAAPVEVRVEVEWETNGPLRRVPLERLIALVRDHPGAAPTGALSEGPWLYQQPRTDRLGLIASREGSLISLIPDPVALLGNPRPAPKEAVIVVPHRQELPVADVPLTLYFSPHAVAVPAADGKP